MRKTIVMLGVFTLLCCWRHANAQERPARIAVYKPLQVMQQCKEYADLKQKFDAESSRLNQEESKKVADLNALVDQQKNLKRDSKAYVDLTDKIEQASVDLDAWKRIVQAQGQRTQNRAIVDLFQRIEAAADAVAKEEKYDIVLLDWFQELPQSPEIDHISNRDLLRLLAQRSISTATHAPDITQKILLRAETDYARTTAAPAAK